MVYGPARALPGDQIAITTNPDTEPFWEAAKEHRLTACQCADCGHFRMPPTAYCPLCQSNSKAWPTLPGTATVFSYAICCIGRPRHCLNPARNEAHLSRAKN